jgi:cytochrome b subunit of formate dehydrogenase
LTIRVRETWTIGDEDSYLPKKEEYYIRMNIHERIQHHLVWSSFVILAITGFMVEFPESWLIYFDPYREEVFYWRGLLHRIFAGVMILNIVYQAVYLAFSKEGRGYFVDMLPGLKDAKDFVQNMSYYLQRTKEKPLFDRFNYKEKLEYWTGWIGNIIITATGFLLWFQEYFPKFIFDLSILIHTMEAILASCAIMVWHFYEVHLKPDKFPMSMIFLDGKISEHELEEEHPLQCERIKPQVSTSQIPDI